MLGVAGRTLREPGWPRPPGLRSVPGARHRSAPAGAAPSPPEPEHHMVPPSSL